MAKKPIDKVSKKKLQGILAPIVKACKRSEMEETNKDVATQIAYLKRVLGMEKVNELVSDNLLSDNRVTKYRRVT